MNKLGSSIFDMNSNKFIYRKSIDYTFEKRDNI
jgi:hypothetical protein